MLCIVQHVHECDPSASLRINSAIAKAETFAGYIILLINVRKTVWREFLAFISSIKAEQ